MSKPSSVPTWATDANYPAGSESFSSTQTKTEPSSGKKAEGYEPKEKVKAQGLNWWMNLVYLWMVWLNGIVAGAGRRFVTMRSDGDLEAVSTLDFSPEAPDWKWQTTRVRPCPIPNGTNGTDAFIPPNSSSIMVPIHVESGEYIESWSFPVSKSSSSGTTLSASLVRVSDVAGTTTTIGSTQTNSENATGNAATPLGQSGLAHAVVSGNTYHFLISSSGPTYGVDVFRKAVVNVTRHA